MLRRHGWSFARQVSGGEGSHGTEAGRTSSPPDQVGRMPDKATLSRQEPQTESCGIERASFSRMRGSNYSCFYNLPFLIPEFSLPIPHSSFLTLNYGLRPCPDV